MAKKKREDKPGYAKLLDAWTAPDDAGDPVGCVATSFTFTPAFFEEECLARFLQLESDPTEDGPLYLVEREEKLAQVACAAALVDQHYCRGSRSLRWDMLAARLPRGLLHAKVSVLYWSKLLRVIVGSANLTDDGYRRNQEVFGVLDYRVGSESPHAVLGRVVDFLRRAAAYSSTESEQSPAVSRWNAFLDRVVIETVGWGSTDEQQRRFAVRVDAVFSGPKYPTVFESLKQLWPTGSPPTDAHVVSPFFDRPEVQNAPARELWGLVRRRGEATIHFHVGGEDIPSEDSLLLYAPKSLLDAEPKGRPGASTQFYRVILASGRPLHAKGIWFEDARWSMYQVGSSNFTSAATGLSRDRNLEANLVYVIDGRHDDKARKLLNKSFPESELVDIERGVNWKPLTGEGEDAVGEEVRLPPEFGDAVYHCDEHQQATVTLSFHGRPSVDWEVITDGDDEVIFGERAWIGLGMPKMATLAWCRERPPSGFWVRWKGSSGSAWWPINVTAGNVLPPPEELKDLPLEVLINILTSARPLHRVLQEYLRRRERGAKTGDDGPIIDPHKRVDTSQFLLQRTRRISWALNALRDRLERPVATLEFLQWRLRGPVGVMALAKALVREAKSDDEKAFLISELALELSRVTPQPATGCLTPKQHRGEIRDVIRELQTLIPDETPGEPENLRQYIRSVFDVVLV